MFKSALHGRVAFITGANSGIGRAIAKEFAEEGAAIAIHYLDQQENPDISRYQHTVQGKEAALKLQEEIRSKGGNAFTVPGDLADPSIIPHLFDQVKASLGTATILVNNAAHCELPDTISETTAGSIDRHFQVNTRAPVLLCKEFASRFAQGGLRIGQIINISTDAAQAFASQISYGASKAALEAYTRSLAIELAPTGITVNAIAAGPVQTGWMSPEQEEQIAEHIPLGRVGEPEDIAHAALFFASERARWITGQVLHVSGGNTLP